MDKEFKDRYFPEVKKKKKKKYLPQIVKDIRSHTKRNIDYSYQKNISFSQISIFEGCPKKWSLSYKEKKKIYDPNMHLVFGVAIHESIQKYLDVMYAESGAEADRLDLLDIFETTFRNEYQKCYKKNNNKHFSDAKEMGEFYEDGVNILLDFKKNKSKYFSKRGTYLVGCEIPITVNPNPQMPNAVFQGFIDVVMYDEDTNTIKIIDIKTSTRSWGSYQKKDKVKQYQLMIYKKYFSEMFKFPIDNIEVEFFIVKRKIPEDTEFPTKRIQIFTPPSGKTSINKAMNSLHRFVDTVFTEDGGMYKDTEHKPTPSDFGCKYCIYSTSKLCPAK